MSKRKLFFFLLPVILFFFLIGLFFLVQTPAVVNVLSSILASKLGYKISVQNLSFSPGLKGDISDLNITRVKTGGLSFYSQHVSFDGKIKMPLKGELESITLTRPKLIIRLQKKKKLDLSFIKRLPPVHLLKVQDGELALSFDSSPLLIKMINIELQVKEFSPQKGGMMSFRSSLQILSNRRGGLEGLGHAEGKVNLVSLFPEPSGKGFVEFHIDSGSYNSRSFQSLMLKFPVQIDREKVKIDSVSLSVDSLTNKRDGKATTLKDLRFRASLSYDMGSKAINVRILDGGISDIGGFHGAFQGTLSDDFPWKASFGTSSLNFAGVFSFLKPFLPSEYQKWLIKGKGIVESHLQGEKLTWTGDLILHFKEGEFGSPDGSKAGQGIKGKLILKIHSLPQDKKMQFDLSSEIGGGELLWGTYYKDFSGERIDILSKGNFFLSSPRILDFQSSLDLFKTANYFLSGSIQTDESTLHLKVKEISHSRILSLVRDYLSQNTPSVKDLLVEGVSDLVITTVIREKRVAFNGNIRIRNAALELPEKSFSVEHLNVVLPFDLFFPSARDSDRKETEEGKGFINIGLLKIGSVRLENMAIPVFLVRNKLSIPEDIKISVFGGDIAIKKFVGEQILSPSRQFYFGLIMEKLDLGLLSSDLAGIDLPGTLRADFPIIKYQDGAWTTQGNAVTEVFGGEVEAANISGRNLFSPSRKIAADLTFKGINLEKVTEKIKIGKMTGIIEGSLRNLEIEYGQLSRFVLDIKSVKTKGIKQKISVDAINNISIVGTGSGLGGILNAGIRRFFKEYPYSKIGIHCTLKNDNFTLRGSIHEGGKEYLVRRAFLRGINVINQNPQNAISFKDMQERIKRISRTQ